MTPFWTGFTGKHRTYVWIVHSDTLCFSSYFANKYKAVWVLQVSFMITSRYGNAFLITGPLWGESANRQFILLIKGLWYVSLLACTHYCDVTMGEMASQITSLTIVYSTVHLGPDQRKHRRAASLAFVRGIQRWPVNSPHKGPVTRKMFPFDDVIMKSLNKQLIFRWFETTCRSCDVTVMFPRYT